MKAASAVASTASAVAGQQANGAAGSPSAAASMYPAMENLRQALYNFHRGTAAGNGNVVLAGASSTSASVAAPPPASGTNFRDVWLKIEL